MAHLKRGVKAHPDAAYEKRINSQIEQFKNPDKLKKLPPIHWYYVKKYVAPKLENVFGVKKGIDIYINSFEQALRSQSQTRKILSIGSGDCNIEMTVAQGLIDRGVTDFLIECAELSPVRLERAKKLAAEKGLFGHLVFSVKDANKDTFSGLYAGVMAHHSLHHLIELERLFDQIDEILHEEGSFVTIDMIGRNGHMRWPEALVLIDNMWPFLPDHYKFQHQFQKYHEHFINFDCSKSGFEGIRAQDILPCLLASFDFEAFMAHGNLPDIFIERGYGHNFSIDNPSDTAFIDFVSVLNELLIDLGHLKPTIMFAVLRRRGCISQKTRCYKHWTPQYCMRDPEKTDLTG